MNFEIHTETTKKVTITVSREFAKMCKAVSHFMYDDNLDYLDTDDTLYLISAIGNYADGKAPLYETCLDNVLIRIAD